MTRVYIGADHNGFKLKEGIKEFLRKRKFEVIDEGNTVFDQNDDYPLFAIKVGMSVADNKSKGILICGTAQGMCIAANKIKGVRAAIAYNVKEAKIIREHNDANIICLPAWRPISYIYKIIDTFLSTKFSNVVRHKRRVDQIIEFEENR
ncbi:MAG: RpiB/LacA/LacB family sugar-phosphate isomerase [Candidatus Aenigmatarchaeota archaeon]